MVSDEAVRFGFGTGGFGDDATCRRCVAAALDAGVRHVDTAQKYGTEGCVGQAIRSSSVPRDEVFVATKVRQANLGYEDVLASVEESRDRLGVSTIDLLYVHWPTDAYDPPATLAAFDELRADGAIRHVGVSNFTPALLEEARTELDSPLFAHQIECHPLLPQELLRADARRHDTWVVAYSPLAGGCVFEVPELRRIADKHGATPAQVSLAWLLTLDRVAVVPHSTDPDHVRENVAARDLGLDDEDVEAIERIDRRERVIDPDVAPWN